MNLVVVAVGLVRDAFGRPEVDAARYRPAGILVQDRDVDPVLPLVEEFDTHLFALRRPLPLHLAPVDLAQLLSVLTDAYRCRWDGGDLDVRWTGPGALPLPPAFERVDHGVANGGVGQRMDVCGGAAVHGDVDVEGPLRVCGVGKHYPRGPPRLSGEGVLVLVPQGNRGHDEARAAGHDLDRFDDAVGLGVGPCPQVVQVRLGRGRVRLPPTDQVPPSLVPWIELFRLVVDRRVGMPYLGLHDPADNPGGPHGAYFEPFPYRHSLHAPSSQPEDVLGDLCPLPVGPPSPTFVSSIR